MVQEDITPGLPSDPRGHFFFAPRKSTADRIILRIRSGLPALAIIVVLAYLVIPILVIVVIRSFQGQSPAGQAEGFTFSNYTSLVSSGALGQALVDTAMLALIACLTTTVIGGGLAWLAERTDAMGARLCRVAMIASFAFPLLVFAYSWTFLWGTYGPVFTVLRNCCGVTQPFFSGTSLPSLAIASGVLLAPFGFFMFSAALRRRDVTHEEAAEVAGVRRWQILLHITLPSLRPALVGVTLLVAIITCQAFDLPVIIGLPARAPVLTTGIYNALIADFPANYGQGSAFAVILLIIISILLAISRRLLRETTAFSVISSRGNAFSGKRISFGRWRWIGLVPFGLFTLLGVVGPIGLAIWTSFLHDYENPSLKALHHAGLFNYATVFDSSDLSSAISNTVILCLVSATLGTGLAAVAAWLCLRAGNKISGRVIRQLSMMPLVFPGIVLSLAVGTLYAYYPGPLYGSIWLIAISYITLHLPLSFIYSFAGVSQIARELEESAATAGVKNWQILKSIVFPLAGPSLAASWVLGFLLSSKDVGVPILLSSPNSRVLSMSILNEGLDGSVPIGFALATVSTLILLGVMAVCFLAFWLVRYANVRHRRIKLDSGRLSPALAQDISA